MSALAGKRPSINGRIAMQSNIAVIPADSGFLVRAPIGEPVGSKFGHRRQPRVPGFFITIYAAVLRLMDVTQCYKSGGILLPVDSVKVV